MLSRADEVQQKLGQVREFLRERDLGALVLSTQANFAWITAGGDDHVGIATDGGVARVVVTDAGQYLLTNNIEQVRLADEEVSGLSFELVYDGWEKQNDDARLGQLVPLADSVFDSLPRWLEVRVDDGINPEETLPRVKITTHAFTYRVGTVDGASGGDVTGDLDVQGELGVSAKATLGPNHTNTGLSSFVAGEQNAATANYVSIAGGTLNAAGTDYSTIGGGRNNQISEGTFGGPYAKPQQAASATIAGGENNSATGTGSTIGGGTGNTATGNWSTVSGGALPTTGCAKASWTPWTRIAGQGCTGVWQKRSRPSTSEYPHKWRP